MSPVWNLVVSLSFCLCQTLTSTADSQCAYSASGVVATPLGECSVYAQEGTTGRGYSYLYSFDAETDELRWNYYSDLECSSLSSSYVVDETMKELHDFNMKTQLIGDGTHCDTVDIVKKGSYSPFSDQCSVDESTANDYTSMSFVVNECISSSPDSYSAVLLCDEEKIWVNFYGGCTDCKCDVEQYLYKTYSMDECWSVSCNAISNSKYHKLMRSQLKLFGAHGTALEPKLPDGQENAAEVVIDSFISNQFDPISVDDLKREQEHILSLDGGWIDSETAFGIQIPSIWMYAAIGFVLFIVGCGLCRYINTYDAAYYRLRAKTQKEFTTSESIC